MIDHDHWLAAWNSADDERILAYCTEDVEVVAVTLSPRARSYQGHDGIRTWLSSKWTNSCSWSWRIRAA